MDLLKEHIKCLDDIQDSNICPNIENLQAAQSYVNYCLNTRLTNISNYNTINFEKLISIYIEFKDNAELQKSIEQIFEIVANNYKFKTKKKHHVHLNT